MNQQPCSDVRIAELLHEIRYRVGLHRCRRRPRFVVRRPRTATGSNKHGSPSFTRRPGTTRRPHATSGRPRTLPVAQTAADRQVVLTDRVAEIVVHRADVAMPAVSVAGARRERPTRLEACTEWIVVGGTSTLTVWAAVAALDCWVTDTTVSTDFVAAAVRVRETSFVL